MAIYKIQGENPEVFGGEHFSRRVRAEYACDYTATEIKELLPDMVHRFKVMDDDGVTYFWGVCSDSSSFAPLDQEGAEYGATAIAYNQEIEAELSGDQLAPYLVQAIRWRSIKDPPKDYQYVIGWPEEETYPFPQARECYTTGRAPWAYFPGIGAQYRISHWAEMPVGPTPKGAKKK